MRWVGRNSRAAVCFYEDDWGRARNRMRRARTVEGEEVGEEGIRRWGAGRDGAGEQYVFF